MSSLAPYTPFDPSSIDFSSRMASPGMVGGFAPTTEAMGGVGPLSQGGLGGWMKDAGIGMNMPTFNAAVNGIGTLGSLWAAFNSAKMAKKQFAFSKNFANANLANQTQSYNTSIADRARARGFTEGQNQDQIADYISKNSLQKRTV